ncbi:hypothetical protein [Streptomyces crystallinus]|uniref:Uncharacterized protein n=1 Tax=Streptomyces crystallinus TaxID=68191 RepID=A0ABP3QEB6_9ACTN
MSDQNDDGHGRAPHHVPPPVISIVAHRGAQVRVDAAITSADLLGRTAVPPSGEPASGDRPFWHRTSVVWSALAAVAAVAAVVIGWAAGR